MSRSRPPGSALSGHVLVADDDAEMRRLCRAILTRSGLQVSEAEHGLSLLERLSDEESGIDVVVSDVRMPVLSGVEVVAMIGRLAHPPIVLMTAFAEPQLSAVALRLGVAAVLAKPFEAEELVRVVREQLTLAPRRTG